MGRPDFNLLATLDVLLSEGSVAGAARRLRLSPSAMSRALARLRETTGDPLLVRAGRGLVPTPRAIALRDQVRQLVLDTETVLRPDEALDLAALDRVFTLRVSDGFVEAYGPTLVAQMSRDAPGVRLNFIQKTDKGSGPLREGRVDLETGVIEKTTGPEFRSQALFRDRLIGVVRQGHLLAGAKVTVARYKAGPHVIVSREGAEELATDTPFLPSKIIRKVSVIVGGFSAALALVRQSDFLATVPERHTAALRNGMAMFELPVPSKPFTVSMLWHPRMEGDVAHRWFRESVRRVCAPKTTRSG
jgi:DNA-binding transcriptional LysR family regulator